MGKEKLTLYVDDKTSRMAHEVANTLGKSVSELVREYTVRMYRELETDEIAPPISKWIGALKTRKTYKVLRNQAIEERLRRHENPD